ncbi:MAG: Asparagine synthetase [candidate division TM6 bacterium GW2011_GWF2_37_49]|nr:MAG: Asparagine synthetase [candidate division TM6 bacterium GW2011_GWF2_37_49]
MCGLAGYLNLNEKQIKIDEQILDGMQRAIAHRGPDGGRIWASDKHQLGLAYRRLSIIDLSDAGMQPMFDKQRSVVVCFNGEIYNYKELRSTLENIGYQFFSTSDTETILYGYKEWGIDVIHRLVGMFAFSIYDFEKRELYLIRDRIGVKPLYFTLQNNILGFASEIKALWHLPWTHKEISPVAAYHYLTFMVTPAPYTIFKEIYKLPAGFYLKIDRKKKLSFCEWYNPIKKISATEKKEFESEQFCLENIKNLLIESTKKRMVSDVPVGAFLSGGIDSSLNVALMSQLTSKLKTFTVAFSDGPESNELKWARMIAQKFGTQHHEITISETEAFSFYEKMVYHLDEPLADCVCIPFYYVAKLARDNGIKVAQVGEGSDELFFGYELYANYKKMYDNFWAPTQKFMPSFMRSGIKNIFSPFLNNNPTKLDLIQNWAEQKPLFWGGAIAFNEQHKKIILSDVHTSIEFDPIVQQIYPGMRQELNSLSIVDYHMSKLKELDPEADFCKQMLYLELKQRLPELLLMRADKMSMAQGLEAREPFLDHKLVEFMMHVHGDLKFKNGIKKYLLKKICRGILPDSVIDRKKVGFSAPTFRWLNGEKLFPAYFQALSRSQNTFLSGNFSDLEKFYKNNIYNFAVQKWVLQNLWAIK